MPEMSEHRLSAVDGGDVMSPSGDSETSRPRPKLERPRKKLSFREPEIVGCEKYRQMKERSSSLDHHQQQQEQRTESIIKPSRVDGRPGEERGAPPTTRDADNACRAPSTSDPARPEVSPGDDELLDVGLSLLPAPAAIRDGSSVEDLALADEALAVVRSVAEAFDLCRGRPPPPARSHTDTGPETADGRHLAGPLHELCHSHDHQQHKVADGAPAQCDGTATRWDITAAKCDVTTANCDAGGLSSASTDTPPLAKRPLIPAGAPRRGPVVSVDAAAADAADARRPCRRQRHARPPHLTIVPAVSAERRSTQRRQAALESFLAPAELKTVGEEIVLLKPPAASTSLQGQIQLAWQQLQQQQLQTAAALAQAQLVRSQLHAETAARVQAQQRQQQLLQRNRQLLQHVQQLVGELHELELAAPETASPDGSTASLSSEDPPPPADLDLRLLRQLQTLYCAPSADLTSGLTSSARTVPTHVFK